MSTESGPAPVRIGTVGCADIATRRMLAAVERASGAVLVAVSSRSATKANNVAARFAADAVVGYEKLLDRSDVDAVYIPLPNELHAQWIERALCAGKHVLAEKPLTTSLSRTEELTSLAEDRRLVLSENVVFPYHSQHARVRALIEDGAVGRIRDVSATFTVPPRPPGDIRYRRDLGGGALLDQGIYPVSAAQLLLGCGLAVVGGSLRFKGEVDVSGGALLGRGDGVTAHISFGMEHAYLSRYEVQGSTGRIVVNRAYTPDSASPPEVLLERDGDVERLAWAADDQYMKVVEAFCRQVKGPVGDPDPAISDRARILDAIRDFAGSTTGALLDIS